MTRPEREQWGELRKFMVKVKSRYPTSQCFLKKTTLFVDTRMFIWSLEEGRVMEQAIISIPTQAAHPLPRLNVQNRCQNCETNDLLWSFGFCMLISHQFSNLPFILRCPAKLRLEDFQEEEVEQNWKIKL